MIGDSTSLSKFSKYLLQILILNDINRLPLKSLSSDTVCRCIIIVSNYLFPSCKFFDHSLYKFT
uniref:Ovule protein n=1 Tax=Meloidogyne incognita TaxID=6306 RepID=A0A914KUE6_MELIC